MTDNALYKGQVRDANVEEWADMVLPQDSIEKVVAVFDNHPTDPAIVGRQRVIDGVGNVVWERNTLER